MANFDFLDFPIEASTIDIPNYTWFDNYLNNRTIIFNDEICENIVEKVILPLKKFEKDDSNEPITLILSSAGGSVFFQKRFTKTAFDSFLDDDYRNTGILEGLVFDKAEGGVLRFAASVSHPNTDEYIPILIKIDRNGNMKMERDVNLDTTSEEEEEDGV